MLSESDERAFLYNPTRPSALLKQGRADFRRGRFSPFGLPRARFGPRGPRNRTRGVNTVSKMGSGALEARYGHLSSGG